MQGKEDRGPCTKEVRAVPTETGEWKESLGSLVPAEVRDMGPRPGRRSRSRGPVLFRSEAPAGHLTETPVSRSSSLVAPTPILHSYPVQTGILAERVPCP